MFPSPCIPRAPIFPSTRYGVRWRVSSYILVDMLPPSFVRLFVRSFVCSFVCPFVRSFVHSFNFVRSFDFVRSISFVRFRSFDFVRYGNYGNVLFL